MNIEDGRASTRLVTETLLKRFYLDTASRLLGTLEG